MRNTRLVAASLVAIVVGIVPTPARASCAEFPPLGEHLEMAEVVFVGTVVELSNEGRTAQVAVEEVWRGEGLPNEVTVHGGAFPEDPAMMTSVDRFYEAGGRYLFAARVEDGRLHDDSCTATRPWTDDLAAFRPTSVTTPGPAEVGVLDGIPAPAIGIALALLAIGAVSIVAFRARP